MYGRQSIASLCLALTFATACSNGDDDPTGRFIRGQVDRTSARAGVAYFGAPSQADAIWVIPVNKGSIDAFGFRERIELPIEADGSFLYTEDMGGYSYDALFALVNTAACSNTKARADWNEADLDERLGCIQGFVSISDAEDSGALTLIPLSNQEEGVDLRGVAGGSDGEARSSTTLAEAAPSFSLDLDSLRSIARTDEQLKAFAYLYANFDDSAEDSYNMHALYNWQAPLANSTNGETNPESLTTQGYIVSFDTLVDTVGVPAFESGYLQLYPPAEVTIDGIATVFGPTQPLLSAENGFSYEVGQDGALAGSAGLFEGVSPSGEWKLRRYGVSGPIVAKYDLSLSTPYTLASGQPDLTQPSIFVPSVVVNETGGVVDSVTWSFNVHDGNGFVTVPEDLVLRLIGSPQIGIGSADNAGCPGESQSLEGAATRTWQPTNSFTLGQSDGTSCPVNHIIFSYFAMGTLYQFFWNNEA